MVRYLDFNLEQKKWHDVVFELDLMLWKRLQSLLIKQPQSAILRFGLTPEVAEILKNDHEILKKLSSGVLVSFKLNHNDSSILKNISGNGSTNYLIENNFNYLDIMYWFSLQKIASIDLEKSIIIFSIQRKIAEWAVSASHNDLYCMAIGTTSCITLRYSNKTIQEILTEDYNSTLFFKKMMLALQVNGVERC